MIVKLILDGLAHVVHIRRNETTKKRVARVHHPISRVPVKVLEEQEPGVFMDSVENERFRLYPFSSMVRM